MTFKIAIIGCGQIAFSHHGPGYQRYAADHPATELIACCDLNLERANEFARRFGFRHASDDWRSMLEREQPDAICLNVPPAMTAALTCQILHMGIPVQLEKPPGLTVTEVDAMIAAADQTGTPNQVAFNRRYTPLLVRLRALLEARFAPGEVHHLHYDFCRVARTDSDFSTTAIHGIDAARFIARSNYASVHLHFREIPEAGPQVANILLDCTFHSGTTAQLSFLPLSGLIIERTEVHAQDNAYYVNTPVWKGFDSPGRLVHVEKGIVVDDIGGIEAAGGEEDYLLNGFYQEDASFFDDIRRGRKPAGDIRSGRQSVIIAQAIRERQTELVFAEFEGYR